MDSAANVSLINYGNKKEEVVFDPIGDIILTSANKTPLEVIGRKRIFYF